MVRRRPLRAPLRRGGGVSIAGPREAAHSALAKVARESGVDVTLTGINGDLFYLSPTPGVRRRYAKVGRLQWCEETERLIGAP